MAALRVKIDDLDALSGPDLLYVRLHIVARPHELEVFYEVVRKYY